ncbi:unnamed protein product [Calypogeia fissa]
MDPAAKAAAAAEWFGFQALFFHAILDGFVRSFYLFGAVHVILPAGAESARGGSNSEPYSNHHGREQTIRR